MTEHTVEDLAALPDCDLLGHPNMGGTTCPCGFVAFDHKPTPTKLVHPEHLIDHLIRRHGVEAWAIPGAERAQRESHTHCHFRGDADHDHRRI